MISDVPPVLSGTSQINTVLQEGQASLSALRRKKGFSKERRVATLFVVVILLELVSGVSLSGSISSVTQNSAQGAIVAAATAQEEEYARNLIEANATAQALADKSPIAYPPQSASLVLDDPLRDNSKGNRWDEYPSDDYSCEFAHQAFDVTDAFCLAHATDFTNFIYEVQMKIVQGDGGGGIVFRSDLERPDQYYSFAINQDSSYAVYGSSDPSGIPLAQGSNAAIHQGLNQTNLVAAVVYGRIIQLYVNHQRIAVVGTSASTHGHISVIVNRLNKRTEVTFQNAKVWKL